ncbi:Hypothetical_protein [Hexamita inflata]|uniref:Hypothetical_protein n=1 Tax=Hexamita inflata TaxID=28002 RepID=A0AA86PQS7_9EUKA|nr:Hypothetical protein HINF_LOCUS27429 [Hexamita inflata]CAI9939800.1 Hypothetical protein HINF_LOCUS27445 [Hexamita inflata]CAI9939801.1 Hypothetical protein HINF_LOCUS27446 [Hexamita inflata]
MEKTNLLDVAAASIYIPCHYSTLICWKSGCEATRHEIDLPLAPSVSWPNLRPQVDDSVGTKRLCQKWRRCNEMMPLSRRWFWRSINSHWTSVGRAIWFRCLQQNATTTSSLITTTIFKYIFFSQAKRTKQEYKLYSFAK